MSRPGDWLAMQVKCPHGGQMFRGTCDCCKRDQKIVLQPVAKEPTPA